MYVRLPSAIRCLAEALMAMLKAGLFFSKHRTAPTHFEDRLYNISAVDLGLQLGRGSDPGPWGLAAAATEYSHNHTSFKGTRPMPGGISASTKVSVPERSNGRNLWLPDECGRVPENSGGSDDVSFVRYYVDDGRRRHSSGGTMRRDGTRAERVTQFPASDDIIIGCLAFDDLRMPPCCLSPFKMFSWSAVLGWGMDIHNLGFDLSLKEDDESLRTIDH